MASRCEDGTVTGDFVDELPNFHIDTISDLEEHSGRFAEVSESDVEKFIEGKENENTKKDLLRLKISQKVSSRKAPRNQRNREDSSNWIKQLLEPVCFIYKDQGWKRLWTVISPQNFGWCWTPFESLRSRDSDFKQKKKRDALKAKQKQLNSMYANNDGISIDRDPVHVYKMYKGKRPPSMLEPDSSFYLSLNYFKTETDSSVEGRNWFKAQPMGVNKLNNIMKNITQAAGIAGKTNHVKQW